MESHAVDMERDTLQSQRSKAAPCAHFNPSAQLASRVPVEGHVVLGELESSVPSMVGVIRVTRAHDPNTWERHDHGDELLVLLSGSCTMTLRDAAGRSQEHVLSVGDALLIPRGVSHCGMPHGDEVQVLFVTPRTGSSEWLEAQAQPDAGAEATS